MDDDKINELYYGQIMSEQAQRRCRERISWITERAAGSRVLDVGCSQGITSILLGRQGYTCLGVDIAPPQIQYANNELSKEQPETQQRVSFRLTDVRQIQGLTFDTVILGEVLEHDEDPASLFETVRGLLSSEGRVLITVPYGNQPSMDHKRSFYLGNLHDLISSHFYVNELRLLNRNIVCTASSVRTANDFKFDQACAREVERVMREIEEESQRLKARLKVVTAKKAPAVA